MYSFHPNHAYITAMRNQQEVIPEESSKSDIPGAEEGRSSRVVPPLDLSN